MLSLLVEPMMYILKKHIALSGVDISKAKYIESKGLDIPDVIDKLISGSDTLAIVYDRGKLIRDQIASKPIEFALRDRNGDRYSRKAIVGTVPFRIAVVTNQKLDLDNLEILHRLELANTSFSFTINIPDAPEDRVEYVMSYHELTNKANEPLNIPTLGKGFHSYVFEVRVQGYLLSPYTTDIEVVSRVDFNLILSSDIERLDEPDTDTNSIRIIID